MTFSIEAERERLHAQNYTSDEISRILVARASAPALPPGPAASAGLLQGVMSGTLNNVGAIFAYLRGIVPAAVAELATVFGRGASLPARAAALISLIVKAALVLVFAYLASLEVSVLQSQAQKAKADACTSRIESYAKNTSLNSLMEGGGDEAIRRDCDPNYASEQDKKAACLKKFQDIFAPLDTFEPFDKRLTQFNESLDGKLTEFKAGCSVTKEIQELGAQKIDILKRLTWLPPLAPPVTETPPQPPPSPDPAPVTLRTPKHFHCETPTLGVDYVICASPQLLDTLARLEDAYAAARAARGDKIKDEQKAWIKRYGPDCGLPPRGRPAAGKIISARGCVQDAMERRIGELQAEQ